MATTTPNYGWTVPTSTDLVKDGATAIETLGDAIDASMNTALGTKKAGMVLLNTTSFSGVASQSINSVFNSTYENYKIIFTFTAGSGVMTLRLRASGTDASGANYILRGAAAADVSLAREAANSATSFSLSTAPGDAAVFNLDIYQPNLAKNTLFTHIAANFGSASSGSYISTTGAHIVSTAYDGFTFFATSMTGAVSIYGYNK
jgi:hypothetical protein